MFITFWHSHCDFIEAYFIFGLYNNLNKIKGSRDLLIAGFQEGARIKGGLPLPL